MLVVEEKGIYSIENFISARRIMYWQVYMHKTVVSSEYMLTNTLRRARELFAEGAELFSTPSLELFLKSEIGRVEFANNPPLLDSFSLIDDSDILSCLKVWQNSDDRILSTLCNGIISRKLFKTEISSEAFTDDEIAAKRQGIMEKLDLSANDIDFFVISEKLVNEAYTHDFKQINILSKDGSVRDLISASDNLYLSSFLQPVEKYALCYHKID